MMWRCNFDAELEGWCSSDTLTGNNPTSMDSEQVMREIHHIYSVKGVGLKDTAKAISERNFRVTMPQQKITVLILGHHNAAKHRFLDLYFSESRQTSAGAFISKVNYDKLDKIYITHGNARKMLTGESVLEYCPHLAQLKNVPGLKDHLTTEIATRNTKSLISFILAPETVPSAESMRMPINDTVELTDDILNNNHRKTAVTRKRSFDVAQAVCNLSDAADLIFLFFDPTGVVSPRETLKPLESLWEAYHEKILLLLAKASETECSEEQREEALAQIVREIWKNRTVRRVGYLPEIYCPDLTIGIRDDERLWNVIQNTADQSIDKALHQLGYDTARVKDKLEAVRVANKRAKDYSGTSVSLFFWFMVTAFILFGAWCIEYDLRCRSSTVQENNSRQMDIKKMCCRFCEKLLVNHTLASGIGFAAIFSVIYILFVDRRPTVLSEEEEKLLEQRIQFANYALYQKSVMEKMYCGMNLN